MTVVSLLPRALDEPLPLDVLADLASRAARRFARSNPRPLAPPQGRWHVRLRVTARYDVWVIGWGVGGRVDLHDHGGSAGALAVVRGSLVEHTPRPGGGTRVRPILPGRAHAFDADHRHDVVNEGRIVAMSAHVYSPPLSEMTFFEPGGRAARTEPVDLPGLVEDR